MADQLNTWSTKWPTNSLSIIIMPFRATNQIKLGWLTNKIYPFYKFLQENGKKRPRNLMILYNKKIYFANWLTTWSAIWPTSSLRIMIMPFRATHQIKLGWLTNRIYPFYKFLQENGKEIDLLSIIPHDASWLNYDHFFVKKWVKIYVCWSINLVLFDLLVNLA